MKILAIDTSTEACSAALWIDADVQERFEIARQRHTDLILPMVDELLADAGLVPTQLDALAFGRGPGSFTGIRIGTGVVQGIALGADLPVAPVSTLAALAQGVFRDAGHKRVAAAIDARMQEIYWACYRLDEHGFMQLQGSECVATDEELTLADDEADWFGAGSAWQAYEESLLQRFKKKLSGHDGAALPHAADIASLARQLVENDDLVPAEQASPVYLRNEVAWKKAK